jgi:hypothetical protein
MPDPKGLTLVSLRHAVLCVLCRFSILNSALRIPRSAIGWANFILDDS